MYNKKSVIAMVFTAIFLSGCWDNIEPENRAFVISLAVDHDPKGDQNFNLSLEMPEVEALSSKSSDDESNEVRNISGQTLTSALYSIDAFSSKKAFYGHTKAVIFGEELLSEGKLFKEAIDGLERNKEISRKILILSSRGEASEILKHDEHDETMVGTYIANFYKKNNDSSAVSVKMDLDMLLNDLEESGSAVIPTMIKTDHGFEMGTSAVIKDFELVGWLEEDENKSYLFILGEGKGGQIVTEYEDSSIPVRIEKNKTKLTFTEQGGQLHCTAAIDMTGRIEEFKFGSEELSEEDNIKMIEGLFEEKIKKDIENTFDKFQKEYQMDGFNLKEHLKKFHYDLYIRYGNEWDQIFETMSFTAVVDMDIRSTGQLK